MPNEILLFYLLVLPVTVLSAVLLQKKREGRGKPKAKSRICFLPRFLQILLSFCLGWEYIVLVGPIALQGRYIGHYQEAWWLYILCLYI